MHNILFHQRLIPNYQIGVMEQFCEKFKNTFVVYGNERKKEPLTNAKISNVNFLRVKNYYPLKQPSFFFTSIIKIIRNKKPNVIITQGSIGNLNLIIFYLLRPFFNYKIILWGHGWNRKKSNVPGNSKEDKYRLYLQRKSDAIVLYSERSKKVLENYIDKNKLFVANNTIDTFELNKTFHSLETIGKDAIKKELNIKNTFNLVFLGRLVKQKNLMQLLLLIKEINDPNIGLHFIGDGPVGPELKQYCESEKLKNVIFHGEISDSLKIGKILYCCDLMVIPRSVGLSVVHSFVFGVPVLVMENVAHGPEIEFIDNQNGFKEYGRTLQEIANKIIDFLNNAKEKAAFSRNARSVIENKVNTESFLLGFEKALEFISKN